MIVSWRLVMHGRHVLHGWHLMHRVGVSCRHNWCIDGLRVGVAWAHLNWMRRLGSMDIDYERLEMVIVSRVAFLVHLLMMVTASYVDLNAVYNYPEEHHDVYERHKQQNYLKDGDSPSFPGTMVDAASINEAAKRH